MISIDPYGIYKNLPGSFVLHRALKTAKNGFLKVFLTGNDLLS